MIPMKTITEKNKDIAKFMGGRIVRTEKYEMPHGSRSEGEIEHWEFDKYSLSRDEYARIGIFKYNRDWNDLMEVVEKIESMGYIVSNDQSDTTILSMPEDEDIATSIIRVFGTPKNMKKIESVFEAVHQFVEYKNSQKHGKI